MVENEKHQKINNNTDNLGLSYNCIDKSLIEDLLKCDLCNIIFDLSTHYPLMIKCGHTFCKRCLSLKTNNNLDKMANKACPFDKTKNVMSLDSAIPNLKLEYIVKKLSSLNILKKQIIINKPIKKGISLIKPNCINNAINTYNNITFSSNLKNNNDNTNTNINNLNKKKENSTSNKNKNNINQKIKNTKINNINLVNTIKNKINLLNVKNINNNNNNINRKGGILCKNPNPPPDGITKTMSSEINDNLNSSQIDEEINMRNDKFIVEDEKFNKGIGINNVTIDTIPMYEERSVGDTSFGGDINEILFKGMTTKKKSITDETITEELNLSSSKNLKKFNLLGNQDSLNNININDMMLQTQKLPQPFLKSPYNFSLTPNKNKFNKQNYNQQLEINSKYNNNITDSSMTNQEDINSLNFYGINNEKNENNADNPQNNNINKIHQIRTVYDKIQLKLKGNSNDKDKKEKNNNIINNISNNIIIINDDNINNINIITDNSSSQSQENIFRNTGLFNGDQFTLLSNDINKKNNFNNNEKKTNQINIIGKNNNIKMNNNILSSNRNNINANFVGNMPKIDMSKHTNCTSDEVNEEKKKQKNENNVDNEKKISTINEKKNPLIKIDKKIKEKINKNKQNENNVSFDSNSISFSKKLLNTNNNLSKSFVNLSGNNLDEFEDKKNKDTQIKNKEKNKDNNKFKTIIGNKSSRSQIEKIKINIYNDNQNKNMIKDNNIKENKDNKDINHLNHPIIVRKKSSNNNCNNNHNEKNNNKDNDIDKDKDNSGNNLNNQNINIMKIISNKNKYNINEQMTKKNNEKKDEVYKRLKNEFELSMNERQNLFINKGDTVNSVPTNSTTNTNMCVSISLSNNIKKRHEEAFNNYFKNQKNNKIEWDKVKIKFFPNNEFFIGIFDSEDKYPKKGILISSNGDYYDGEFVNGKKEGEGKLIYLNGNEYEGSFAGGYQNGKGKIIQIDGEAYEGYWKNGKMNGQGIRIYGNGDKYIGNHLNNVRNGQGIYYFANGDSYSGNWVDGKANGEGVLNSRNGDIYEGEFINNDICGKGKLTKKNGDIYTGNFNYGIINGTGKYENALGEQYIGEFMSGKRHGLGKLYNKEGRLIQAGNWKNDKYCGNININNNNSTNI